MGTNQPCGPCVYSAVVAGSTIDSVTVEVAGQCWLALRKWVISSLLSGRQTYLIRKCPERVFTWCSTSVQTIEFLIIGARYSRLASSTLKPQLSVFFDASFSMDAPKSGLNLLDLPNEILLWITDHANRLEDLENFTQCSKLICFLATKTLSIRRARKRKCSTLVVGGVNFYEGNHVRQRISIFPDQQHPIFALQKLLTERSIPDHCKTLRIGGVDNEGAMTGRYGDHVAVEAATITRNLNDQLVALIVTEPYR